MTGPDNKAVERIRLWDPLLRLFHWTLAAVVTLAWGLGRFGPDRMALHFWLGYAVIALLAFRLVWGLVGPASARFSGLVHGPKATLAYAASLFRRKPSNWRGHNPLGGLYILVLLTVLALQVLTGLFADPEDYVNVGPLAGHVSIETARSALGWHGMLGNLLFGLVLLHLAAIVFYRLWKREDLVRPMLTGIKTVRR
jgi:cytochrome b